MHHDIVFLVLIIESEVNQFWVVTSHDHHCGRTASGGLSPSLLARLLLSLYDIEEVDGLKFEDLGLFVVPEQGLQNLEGLL